MTSPSRFVGPLVGCYRTILVDPPWPERGGGKIKRGADRHYALMSLADILALPVQQLAHPGGCHLYLWATNNHLDAAHAALIVWGFDFVTCRTWVKAEVAGKTPEGKPLYALQPAGLGQYFRGDTEQLLFARLGPPLPYRTNPDTGKRAQARTSLLAPRTGHSAKPPQAYSDAELVSPGPRIELFARREQPGWDCWGNEVKGLVQLLEGPAPTPAPEANPQLELGARGLW